MDYKLAVLTFRCLHGQALPYLTESLLRTADVDSRRHVRSAMTNSLVVPSTRCLAIGDRSFAAAASRVWNSLPSTVTSLSSLTSFKRHLKTELFTRRFIIQNTFSAVFNFYHSLSCDVTSLCHLNHIRMYVCTISLSSVQNSKR